MNHPISTIDLIYKIFTAILHRKKIIYLNGYYGYLNFGDDIFLEIIKECKTESSLLLIAFNSSRILYDHATNSYCLPKSRYLIRILGSLVATKVLMGGGGLLKDPSYDNQLAFFASFIDIFSAALFSKYLVLWSIGFGKIYHNQTKSAISFILSRAHLSIFRDDKSYALSRVLGCKHSMLATDAVFSFCAPYFNPLISRLPPNNYSNISHIALALAPSDLKWAAGKTYYGEVVALYIRAIIKVFPSLKSVTLLLSSNYSEDAQLEKLIYSLLESHSSLSLKVHHLYSLDLKDACELFCDFELVISQRYHASILSILAGVPLVASIVDAKVQSLITSLCSTAKISFSWSDVNSINSFHLQLAACAENSCNFFHSSLFFESRARLICDSAVQLNELRTFFDPSLSN